MPRDLQCYNYGIQSGNFILRLHKALINVHVHVKLDLLHAV